MNNKVDCLLPGRLQDWRQRLVLESYRRYHRREYLSPDPLEMVLPYRSHEDREVVAILCSSLALGRVGAILDACRSILAPFPRPARDVTELSKSEISRRIGPFVYRFFSNTEVTNLLWGVGRVIGSYGSLQDCFAGCALTGNHWDAMARFSAEIRAAAEGRLAILLPDVSKGGACKRLNLFLRWMVRSDEIDPGGWWRVSPRNLFAPVDTHLLKAARLLGMTSRKSADRRASEEITSWLGRLRPNDPTAFDFSLTRYGIHPVLRAHGALDSVIRDVAY